MSLASSSSFGSGAESYDSEGSSRHEPGGGEGHDDDARSDDGIDNTWEFGAFGILYQEQPTSWVYAGIRMLFDFIQIFIIVVNPRWGWDIDTSNTWWLTFSFLRLEHSAIVRGYTFLVICIYIWVVSLFVTAAACVWAAAGYKANDFKHTWLLTGIRYYRQIFLQVLDVAGLTLLLIPFDCNYFGVPEELKGRLYTLPDHQCFQMPHLIHMLVCAFTIPVFLALSGGFIMAEVQPNLVSLNPLGMSHTKAESIGFTTKMLMVIISTFLTMVQWKAVFLFIASVVLVAVYLRWMPHQYHLVNYIKVGYYLAVSWAALMLMIIAYHPGQRYDDSPVTLEQRSGITKGMWAGLFPIGFFGVWLAYKRKQYMIDHVYDRFKAASDNVKAHRIHSFTDAVDVEVASRCCRVWIDEGETLDDEHVEIGLRVVLAGSQMLPRQPYARLLLCAYLMDVVGSYHTGYRELKEARRMPGLTLLERYLIYMREQENILKAMAVSNNDENMTDLAGYVEYQRTAKLTFALHKDALLAKRAFWNVLQHRNVTFRKVSNAVARIEQTIRAADRMYKQVLSRHANSLDLLTLYVKFLQDVRDDPWSAAHWQAEVEKMQRIEEEANQRALMGNEYTSEDSATGNKKAVIVMGANCIMRMVNETAASILGFPSRNDLMGNNVNIIVPPPFCRNHNNYVRNYLETGVAKIIGGERELIAVHKLGYVVPITVLISKISGVGEDSVFMAVFEQQPPEPDTAMIWVMNNGAIVSCDREFSNWFGYRHENLAGKQMASIMVNTEKMDEMLAQIKSSADAVRKAAKAKAEAEAAAAKGGKEEDANEAEKTKSPSKADKHKGPKRWTYNANGVAECPKCAYAQVQHLYLKMEVPVEMTITLGGVGDTALFEIKMKRRPGAPSLPKLLVTNSKGCVMHATTALAEKLGTSVENLQALGQAHALDALLPLPFQRLHHQWARNKIEVPAAYSCMAGMTFCLNGRNDAGPCSVPFKLKIKHQDQNTGSEALAVAELQESSIEQMFDERRVRLLVNQCGVVQSANASPVTLFGLNPAALVGKHLAYIIDVFQPKLPADGLVDSSEIQAAEARAAQMISDMAQKSYEKEGMSWRVGVTPVMNPSTLSSLGPVAQAIMAAKMIPAVMSVTPWMPPVDMEGCEWKMPGELLFQVELWRADMLSGVLELDINGNIDTIGVKDQPVFNPYLLFGLPTPLIKGTHIGTLIPTGKDFMESLFTENSMAPKSKMAKQQQQGGAVRGVLRAAATRRRDLGPIHIVKIQHGTDGGELELQVQAVVKQRLGPNTSLYITIHASHPRCGGPGFAEWLDQQPEPSLPLVPQVPVCQSGSRRASMEAIGLIDDVRQPPALGAPTVSGRRASIDEGALKTRGSVQDGLTGSKATRFLNHAESLKEAVASPGIKSLGKKGDAGKKQPGDKAAEDKKQEAATSKMEGVVEAPKRSKRRSSDEGLKKKKRASSDSSSKESNSDSSSDSDDGQKSNKISIFRKISTISSTSEEDDGRHDDEQHDSGHEEESESENESEKDRREEAEMARQEARDNADMNEDEGDSGAQAVAELKRGKRLKRLTKTLMSPAFQAPALWLRYLSIVVVMCLILVDLVMFIMFWRLLTVQREQVNDLRSTSKAVNSVMQIAIATSALQSLLSGDSNPNLRHLGAGGYDLNIAYAVSHLEQRTERMDYYHHGVYRGFQGLRQLPDAYGLREIWEQPLISMRVFYQLPTNNSATNVNMSLWDAGNQFIICARNILQNFERTYGENTGNGKLFVNDTDSLFILYNAPAGMMTAYQATLDGLMRKAVDDSITLNSIQLIILAVEGVVVGTFSVVIVWVMAHRSIFRRFVVFSLFMMVPPGVIRTLATQPLSLGLGNEENQNRNQDGGSEQDTDAASDAGAGLDVEGAANGNGKPVDSGSSIKIALAIKPTDEETKKRGCWGNMIAKLMFWKVDIIPASKRRLQHSLTVILGYTWPFMFWMVLVILLNSIGYQDLRGMSAPIAISNLVQFLTVRVNRIILMSQRYVSQQYFTADITGVAPVDVAPGVYNPLSNATYTMLYNEYPTLRLEYDAMLYGWSSPDVQNSSRKYDPHFALATTGIIFTQGAKLMYDASGCLSAEADDCYSPAEKFYRYTQHGVDQAMQQFFLAIESLLMADPSQLNLDNLDFKYIWEVGYGYIAGGLSQLADVFVTSVDDKYQKAFVLHVIALVLCIGLGAIFLFFVERPAHTAVMAETRRVAQLLSALPPQYDIEGMLTSTLAVKSGGNSDDAQSQMEASRDQRSVDKATAGKMLKKASSRNSVNSLV